MVTLNSITVPVTVAVTVTDRIVIDRIVIDGGNNDNYSDSCKESSQGRLSTVRHRCALALESTNCDQVERFSFLSSVPARSLFDLK